MTFVFLSFGFVSDFGFRVSTLVCSWRPLRLCGSPRGILTRPRSSCSPEALFHRASHRLSDSLNPNSTENFKYVWLVLDSWGGVFWSIPRLVVVGHCLS